MTSNNLIIKLVRHGESQSNAAWINLSTIEIPTHQVALTPLGEQQAINAGKTLDQDGFFTPDLLVYRSPYQRTRHTCDLLLQSSPLKHRIYEDPRLREVEFGYEDDRHSTIDTYRAKFGKFYYRPAQGESPADCYDRICTFLESLMRQVTRKNASKVLIACHGLTIRCFIMRFFHLTIEEFDDIKNPLNGDIVTIAQNLANPFVTSGRWGVNGVSWYSESTK